MSYVNTFDTLQEKQDTNQKDTEETLKKGDVDINNPGDNDTNKDNSSQDNNEQTKPDNTWNKIMNSIKSWFKKIIIGGDNNEKKYSKPGIIVKTLL